MKPPKTSRKISVLRSRSPLQSKSRSRWLKEPTWMPWTRAEGEIMPLDEGDIIDAEDLEPVPQEPTLDRMVP